LYIDFTQKIVKEGDKKPKSNKHVVAVKLIDKWKKFYKTLESRGIEIPELFLSCDNGYDHSLVIEAWGNKTLSVPKKSNKITIDGNSCSINNYIKNVFLPEEEVFLTDNPNSEEPFTKRIRATYNCRGIQVILLFFRYNYSKKVSVVYCTDLNAKEKTIRRNWFQRTYIEQYFKIIKHVLQIQETRPSDKARFECNLNVYMFLALQVQLLIKWLRKECDFYHRKGFINLRQTVMNSSWIKSYLRQSINDLLQ